MNEATLPSVSEPHAVEFYEQSSHLVDRVTEFVSLGLAAGEATLVIATEYHRVMIDGQLRARGVDLDEARRSGAYVDLDAAETLSKFMRNGRPDRALFSEVIGTAVASAKPGARFPILRAYGEMVAVLWADRQAEAAIQLEELWNDLLGHHPFSLLCGYPITGLEGRDVARIASTHTHIHDSWSRFDPEEMATRRRKVRLS